MPVEVQLADGNVTIVDEEDVGILRAGEWFVNSKGYVVRRGRGPGKRLHRRVMARKLRRNLRRDQLTDHLNRDKLDNTRGNLRLATQSQNQFNRGPDTGYRFKGVRLLRREKVNRWDARITCRGKRHYLGVFATPEDAARAYNAAAIILHGEYVYLNDVDPLI